MVFFLFIQILKETSVSKQCFAASDLVLHCLPMSHKRALVLFGLSYTLKDDQSH